MDMREVARIVMVVLALGAISPLSTAAQDPMPYPEYRAAIDAFRQAESERQEGAGTLTTVADAVARYEESLDRQSAEVERLSAITPEPCYADAHEEYVAYLGYAVATLRDTLPLVAEAESVMGMLPMLLAADATIRAAHPLAYVEDTESLTGFRAEPTHIFDALATCAPAPGSIPSPSPAAAVPTADPLASPKPAAVVFAEAGEGTKSTAPFELAAGDHRLTYAVETSGTSTCGMGFGLESTDHSYSSDIGSNGAWVYEGRPYRNESWFYVPVAGRYYLDVQGDCAWDVTLESAPSPLDGTMPITFTGNGLGSSPSFSLPGGDYLVRYVLTSARSDEDCSVSTSGLVDPSSPYSALGGDFQRTFEPGTEIEGETYVYSLTAGRYIYDVDYAWCQFGLSEPVAWTITIEAL
jgi:hypothetical protein